MTYYDYPAKTEIMQKIKDKSPSFVWTITSFHAILTVIKSVLNIAYHKYTANVLPPQTLQELRNCLEKLHI